MRPQLWATAPIEPLDPLLRNDSWKRIFRDPDGPRPALASRSKSSINGLSAMGILLSATAIVLSWRHGLGAEALFIVTALAGPASSTTALVWSHRVREPHVQPIARTSSIMGCIVGGIALFLAMMTVSGT